MKAKKLLSKTKRIVISTMAAVCALSSVTAISAGAASATKTGTTNVGYRVTSTVSYSGKTVSGTGRVASGGPITIEVSATGYYKSSGVSVVSCSIYDKVNEGQVLTKTTSGNYTLTSASCTSIFSGSTTVTASV